MTMSWLAEVTRSRAFAAPSSAEVSIEAGALAVRRRQVAQRFDLGSADVKVTRYQWHMDDGTALEIRNGTEQVCIGGRGAFFPDLPYERAVVDQPELVMAGPAFEELHAALVGALPEGSPAAEKNGARRFLLWRLGEGGWTTVLAPFGVIVVGGASTRLPVPFAIHVALALLLIAVAAWRIARSEGAAKLAALALTIDGALVTVDRLRPATSRLVSRPLAAGDVEHGHWPPRYGPLDFPMIRLSLGADPPVRQLSIGSARPWQGTHGPRRPRPDYLMAAAWWPAFVEAVTGAARARG